MMRAFCIIEVSFVLPREYSWVLQLVWSGLNEFGLELDYVLLVFLVFLLISLHPEGHVLYLLS